MDFDRITKAVSGLKLMKFFPSDEDALLILINDLSEMADVTNPKISAEEQIEWMVRRVRNLYPEWPGLHELRAVFCSRFKPRDGINAYSTVYLDGIPKSPESLAIAGPELKALPPGHTVSADKGVEDAVHIAARTNHLTRNMGGPATPEEIAAAPQWLRHIYGLD